jgi:outer membrane receptor protein involved in Fe transport
MRIRVGALILLLVAVASRPGVAASDYSGHVRLAGVPIPGATVTATSGDRKQTTITDSDGVYRFIGLADGVWTVRVEMVGFEPLTFEVTIPPPTEGSAPISELTLLPLEKIVGNIPPRRPATAAPTTAAATNGSPPPQGRQSATPAAQGGGFQRAGVNQVAQVPAAPANFPEEAPADPTGMGAAAGLLINGSVNNGASTPFAQARAFGTNRPDQRSLYTYASGVQLGNSAWDARPYSLTGQPTARPSYTDAQFLGTFQGPFRIPRVRNQLNVFLGYQGTSDHNAITQWTVVPTALERAGDFSQTRNGANAPVTIIDPATGVPFPGNRIPRERISPEAAALLAYYPAAADEGIGGFNYQTPIVTATRQDSIQSRFTQSPTNRTQLNAIINYQRGTTDSANLFGFPNSRRNSAIDTQANWSYRLSQFMTLRARYQFTRQSNTTVPYFSNLTNVSADAGIRGNNQDPINWGPPSLVFASDLAGLSDVRYADTRNATHAWSGEALRFGGRHTITFGAEARRHVIGIVSQQDPRGTFSFTGATTGLDFADFLLGRPQTSSIAFGNADKDFRNNSYAAYVTDDWRLSPSFTMNLGVRWEYESPISERRDRLVNLDIAPGFTAVAPVVATGGAGALTGTTYPDTLLHSDASGIQPRVGVAWRPIPGSSLVVRAGYGIYRNTNVYQSIATALAQQPPLSTTFNVASSPDAPLTLADGFLAVDQSLAHPAVLNTFAADPNFKVGFAQNWQASLQRDLPGSLTVVATYLGAKGSRLMQQFVPNTFPIGAAPPCPDCPTGFRYLTSGGRSIRNAGQVQLRRRLRNGLTASVQYTLAKAMDNAAAFGGASLEGGVLAQNWLDLESEYARSSFDQRHQIVASFEYTTGAGVVGGTLLEGWKGRLLKDWTFTSQVTTGSGLPFTPIYFAPVGRTGIIGATRPRLTGVSLDAVRDGYYANRAAFAPPAPGEWGDARRNSLTGPAPFSLNAALARTFRIGDRMNLDWRVDATNVLNRITYASVNALITSQQFGLPTRPNDSRKLRSSFRLRF